MNVLITGASGFIARHLAELLTGEGHRVLGISRSGQPLQHFAAVHKASLGERITPLLEGDTPGAVIHAANDTSSDSLTRNVDGTRLWFEEARGAGASLQILLSTLSAREDATSDYGRAKYQLEQMFTSGDQVAFRLGVVVGNGGMFANMVQSLRGPVVPLLDGGTPKVHVLGIEFLCRVIRDTIDGDGGGLRGDTWNLQQPTAHTLRDVLTTIREVHGLGCRFVPVPSLPILIALQAIDWLPLPLPVNSTNIKGLRQSRHESFHSDFGRFGYPEESLMELVRAARRR